MSNLTFINWSIVNDGVQQINENCAVPVRELMNFCSQNFNQIKFMGLALLGLNLSMILAYMYVPEFKKSIKKDASFYMLIVTMSQILILARIFLI